MSEDIEYATPEEARAAERTALINRANAANAAKAPKNPALIALIVVGVLLLVVGAILGFSAAHQLAFDQNVNDFSNAFNPDTASASSPQMGQDTALMWGGIIAAILGAVTLILAGVVAALRPRQ